MLLIGIPKVSFLNFLVLVLVLYDCFLISNPGLYVQKITICMHVHIFGKNQLCITVGK